jgi:hypothetical protein
MNEATLQLGLLMEAAHSHQKIAESSLKKLKAHSQELATLVREEVHCALVDELQTLAADSQRAADALHSIRRAANARVVLWSVGLTALCSAIPLGMACWIVPSPAEIRSLRAKHDELASRIALLEQRGGRIDLRRCGEGGRLCVRVDRTAPMYGEKADYLIVRGY